MKNKCFITGAFPYMNGLLHIGHARVFSTCDVIARYNKLKGKKVLYPMAFHVTGTPIIATSEKVKNRDEKYLKILREIFKIPEQEIEKFVDPFYVAKYYMKKTEETMKKAGLSIDWSRKFFTTDHNPQFNRFIEWQFKKLYEKGYIIKGEHPVKWDPVYNMPLGDHDIDEGEEAQIQEFTVIKFKYNDLILPCATLRPETVFGVTNLWINPDAKYIVAKIGDEKWVLSKEAFEKIKYQKDDVEYVEDFDVNKILNKKVLNPVTKEEIPVFEAKFVNPDNATGIVMSVPTHAPFDYVALKDLGKLDEVKLKYLIDSNVKVEDIVKKLNIKSQNDKEKLEEATKKVYKEEFHKGIFIYGNYNGKKVSEVKDLVKKDLLEKGLADIFYEFTEPVISRFGNKAVVKVVKDQWFIDYGNPEWKKLARECLDQMKIYPEEFRKHFESIIDWLDKKACTREIGLGTKFPFDKRFVIESLSDSTIYPAYYTISGIINRENIKAVQLTDELFDYIFLEDFDQEKEKRLEKQTEIPKEIINEMKREFEFWYPVDYRVSGKDLVPNHLTFYIFNHVAIFRRKHWPKAIVAVGYVGFEGRKMSKSKGNVLNWIDAIEMFGADTVRFYITSATDIKNDLYAEIKELEDVRNNLEKFKDEMKEYLKYEESLSDLNNLDKWILLRLKETMDKYFMYMDELKFRNAVSEFFYLFYMNDLKWYKYRGAKRGVLKYIAKRLCAMMFPFVNMEDITDSFELDVIEIEKTKEIEIQEKYIKDLLEDIKNAIKLSKIEKPTKIYIYTAPKWMWKIAEKLKETKNIKEIMEDPEIREQKEKAIKVIKRLMKENVFDYFDEEKILRENKEFFEKELGIELIINPEENIGNKRDVAIPTKPGIAIV